VLELQKFEFQKFLDFAPDKGLINFSGSRRMLFHAESLGELRRELLNSLGDNIARGILTRFGYQWGKKDAEALGRVFHNKAEWLKGGPMMHSLQGVVQAENITLDFTPSGKLELMKGIWRHSYEAEQHLRLNGVSDEGVCWSLTGYASGYATQVLGAEVLCMETSCVGSGDSECIYEIRPVEAWGNLAKKYLAFLKPNSVVKSLGRMLQEERERAAKRRLLVQAVMEISSQKEMHTIVREIAHYAKSVSDSECALVMIFNHERSVLFQEVAGDKSLARPLLEWNKLVETLVATGEVIHEYDISSQRGIPELFNNVLGIPLLVQGKVWGAIFAVNKQGGENFTIDDEESLLLIAGRVGVVLENVYTYRKINQELEATISNLQSANEMLNIQYRNLEESINLQQQLLGMVIEGKGLKSILQTMGMLVGGRALVLNDRNKVVARYGETAELQAFAFSGNGLSLSRRGGEIRILEQEEISSGMNLRGTDTSDLRLVVLPVNAGGRQLGLLIVGEAERQFTEIDMVAIRQTAMVIALEMLKGIEVELQYRTNFFDQLLAGTHENSQSLQEQGEKMGFNVAEEHQLVLVEVEENQEDTRKIGKRYGVMLNLEDFMQVVTKAAGECAPGSAVFTKDGSIILLIKMKKVKKRYTPDISNVVSYVLDNLKRAAAGRQYWITVGRLCRNMGDYPKSYDEARAAIKVMKKLKLSEEVLFYDQLGVFSIMYDVNPQKLQDFINQVLGKLIDYDKRKNGDLVETLKFYIKNNYNLQQAAKAGFLSPSTLKYRLKKIQEVGNLDFNDPNDRLHIELALKINRRV